MSPHQPAPAAGLAGLALALCVCLSACKPPGPAAPAPRPFGIVVPPSYTAGQPMPLIVSLHGYGADGDWLRQRLALDALAQRHPFIFAFPDGTRDRVGARFWNATEACCDFYQARVDDVAYLGAVIAEIRAKLTIDPRRIYLIGHSNGGFMASRLACERADLIAAFISLAGGTSADPERCRPTAPVAALFVHGDADQTVLYGGGDLRSMADGATVPPAAYPSARASVGVWLLRDRCDPAQRSRQSVPGYDRERDTTVERWAGCQAPVELWTIHGAHHLPGSTEAFHEALWSFLSAHPKP